MWSGADKVNPNIENKETIRIETTVGAAPERFDIHDRASQFVARLLEAMLTEIVSESTDQEMFLDRLNFGSMGIAGRMPDHIAVFEMRSHVCTIYTLQGVAVGKVRVHSLKKAQYNIDFANHQNDVPGEIELRVKNVSTIANLDKSLKLSFTYGVIRQNRCSL